MRPEDKTDPNPVYTLTPDRPGSDVVAAMSAAMSIASVVFADVDAVYSAQLLASAQKAYDFAVKYKALYNAAIPDAAQFYKSNNFYDDLAWAAIWLGVRTGDTRYRAVARDFYKLHWCAGQEGAQWEGAGGACVQAPWHGARGEDTGQSRLLQAAR